MNYIKIKKINLFSRFSIFMVLIFTIIGIVSTLGLNNNFQSVYGEGKNNTLSSTDTTLLKPKSLDNSLFTTDTIQKDNLFKPKPQDKALFTKDILQKDNLFKPKPQGNPLNTDDDEFVASGDASLTIYTKFSGVDDGNFQYVQNVGVCVGTQYLTDHHEIPANPQCTKNSGNGVKYTVQAPGKIFVYLSYLIANYGMNLGSSSCENDILPGQSQSCTLTIALKPLPFK